MMRVTVLHAPGARVGAIAAYYGAAAYYTDPDEPPGRWWGRGRAAVGLDGDVVQGQLELMLDARHPGTGDKVGRGYGDKSARGYDATFSAPKSVSVLWALADDPTVRQEVLAAHDAAVGAALGWIETHGNVTRRGTDGVHQVDARGLTVAVFRQHTSRTLDPQLHTHAVIWGKVQDTRGKWLALDARWLLRQQRSISWVYDAALRTELQQRLGVMWQPVPPRAGQSDIAGVPEHLLELFSQRSKQVDAKLAVLVERWSAENDGAEPDTPTMHDLERRAVLASRPNKVHGITVDELRQDWSARAGTSVHPSRAPERCGFDSDAIVRDAIGAVAEGSATWLEADLAREVAARLPAGAAGDADRLVELIDSLARTAAARCVELHPPPTGGEQVRADGRPTSEHVTDRLLSAPVVLEQEEHLVRWARGHVQRPSGRTVAESVAGLDHLVLIVGPAGAGKTTAVKAGVAQLRVARRPVLGLAPSGKGAMSSPRPPAAPPPRWPSCSTTSTAADRCHLGARRSSSTKPAWPAPKTSTDSCVSFDATGGGSSASAILNSSQPSDAAGCSPTGATPFRPTSSAPSTASSTDGKPTPALPCAAATPTPPARMRAAAGSTAYIRRSSDEPPPRPTPKSPNAVTRSPSRPRPPRRPGRSTSRSSAGSTPQARPSVSLTEPSPASAIASRPVGTTHASACATGTRGT